MKCMLDDAEEDVVDGQLLDDESVSVKWKGAKVVKTERSESTCKRIAKGGHHAKLKWRPHQDPKDKVEQLCRVCAEQAAGYHYGVFTCEGCKSFFGRYQKGKRKPPQECMNGHGQCDVKSRARNRCRYCRYQKCLSAGMSKSASRYGRRSNWFKVHCLSEAQEEDVKCVIPQAGDSEKCLTSISVQNLINPSAFAQQHSPTTQISVIMPPAVVNPKPVYPLPPSPHFASTMPGNDAIGSIVDRGAIGSFPSGFVPKPSLIPIHQQFFYPAVPATSAFSPMLGYYQTPSVVNMGLQQLFLSQPSVQPMAAEPIQSEPLDLSVKATSSKT